LQLIPFLFGVFLHWHILVYSDLCTRLADKKKVIRKKINKYVSELRVKEVGNPNCNLMVR
jgi:hypothetical protein